MPRRAAALLVLLAALFGATAEAQTAEWTREGAAGANIRSIAIDPTDPARVYAAARNDAIWLTTPRGWVRSEDGLDFISAWGVSVDPSNPRVVWAATEMGGAYRSENYGRSWRPTNAGMTDTLADYAYANPSTSNLSLLNSQWTDRAPDKANRGGMWGYPIDQCLAAQKQADAPGQCAERADRPVGGYDLRDPDIDANTPGNQPASEPYPRHLLHYQFSSDIAATAEGALFTAFRGSNNGLAGGAFASRDAGETWEMALRRNDANRTRLALGSAGNLYKVRIAPTDANRVYLASTGGVWRSQDGGRSWVGNAPVVAGRVPRSSRDRVTEVISGQAVAEVRGLAVDPTNPLTVYAGTWGAGVSKSVDGGATWAASSRGLPPGSGIWDIAVNPLNPSNVFAAVFWHGVFQSTDAGSTWTQLNAGFNEDVRRQVYAVAADSGTPQTLYAGTIDGVWAMRFGAGPRLADTGGRAMGLMIGLLFLSVAVIGFRKVRVNKSG